jgi:hypothetical protein
MSRGNSSYGHFKAQAREVFVQERTRGPTPSLIILKYSNSYKIHFQSFAWEFFQKILVLMAEAQQVF